MGTGATSRNAAVRQGHGGACWLCVCQVITEWENLKMYITNACAKTLEILWEKQEKATT
jgi:hypothetical protein